MTPIEALFLFRAGLPIEYLRMHNNPELFEGEEIWELVFGTDFFEKPEDEPKISEFSFRIKPK